MENGKEFEIRKPSLDDAIDAALYINYLDKQFKQQPDVIPLDLKWRDKLDEKIEWKRYKGEKEIEIFAFLKEREGSPKISENHSKDDIEKMVAFQMAHYLLYVNMKYGELENIASLRIHQDCKKFETEFRRTSDQFFADMNVMINELIDTLTFMELEKADDKLVYCFQFYYGYLRQLLNEDPQKFDR